ACLPFPAADRGRPLAGAGRLLGPGGQRGDPAVADRVLPGVLGLPGLERASAGARPSRVVAALLAVPGRAARRLAAASPRPRSPRSELAEPRSIAGHLAVLAGGAGRPLGPDGPDGPLACLV